MIFYRLLILKACRDYYWRRIVFLRAFCFVVVMRDIVYIFFDEKINGNDAPLILLLVVVNQLVCLEIE